MSECLLNPFESQVTPLPKGNVEENFFGEVYDSPEKTPSYVSTYIDNDEGLSLNEVIKKLGDKMVKIGDNFVSYIQSFENLRFEREGPDKNSSQYGRITGYNKKEEKFLLVGDQDGERVVIGALPPENSNYPNTLSLIQSIRNKIATGVSTAINKSKLSNLIENTYYTRPKKANPLSLSKHNDSLVKQTLADLKLKYGDSYPYIFSSPYIVTGKFNLKENYAGRTVIIYNKFPKQGETVDSLIQKYGHDRTVRDRVLGVIPLSNEVYKNFNDLLDDVERYAGKDIDYRVKMFASSPSINQFVEILIGIQAKPSTSPDLNVKIVNFLRNVSIGNVDGEIQIKTHIASPANFIKHLQEIRDTPNSFYEELNKILEANIDPEGFKGIYINPIMLKHNTDLKSGLALVDTSLGNFIPDNLEIRGLSPNVVQPQRLEFILENTTQDVIELFTPEVQQTISNVTPSDRFNYTNRKAEKIGREIQPSQSKLLDTFEQYGIYSSDIEQWVKRVTSEVLLNSDNTNFTKSLEQSRDKLTEKGRDCI